MGTYFSQAQINKWMKEAEDKKKSDNVTQPAGDNDKAAGDFSASPSDSFESGVENVPKTNGSSSATPQTPDTSKSESNDNKGLDHNDYYDLAQKYAEEYFMRGEFDAESDDIYRGYRAEIIKQAENARRDTTAQAAALTGGYGSSYAAALGAAAANSEMDALPAAYETALARYNENGEKLLTDAERAKAMGDYLYAQSPEYLSALSEERENERRDIEHSLRTETIYGSNDDVTKEDEGGKVLSVYDIAMEFVNMDKSEEYMRSKLSKWKLSDGTKLTREQIDYLIDSINLKRAIKAYSAITDASGKTLSSYISNLKKKRLHRRTDLRCSLPMD